MRSRSRPCQSLPAEPCCKELAMLSWALAFLIVALLAALLGFTGIVGPASWIAKLVFGVFLALFLVAVISNRRRRGSQQSNGLKEMK